MHGVMETFLIQVPSAGFPHAVAYRPVIEMSGEWGPVAAGWQALAL